MATVKCRAGTFERTDLGDAPFVQCQRKATHGDYCVLHAPTKQPEEFNAAFQPLLADATLDVSEFVFPEGFVLEIPEHTTSILARRTRFGGPVRARARAFSGLVYFRGAQFDCAVDFSHSVFLDVANFQDTSFMHSATFEKCRFKGPILFMFSSRFSDHLNFKFVECDSDCVMQYLWARSADFSRAVFSGQFKAYGMDVLEYADFGYVDFRGRLLADDCHFGRADFTGSQFNAAARIGLHAESGLWYEPSESDPIEPQDVPYEDLVESGVVPDDWGTPEDRYWWGTGRPELSYELTNDYFTPNECRAQFVEVLPGDQLRISGDMSFVEFRGTDLSHIDFSGATWRTIGQRKVLYEEVGLREQIAGRPYEVYAEADEVAASYRGLRKQYEDRLAYHEASDFHVGEMEMRRLAGFDPWSEPFGRFRRARRMVRSIRFWYRRYCSFTAMYSYLSRYGESYVRPIAWAFGSILGFTMLYLGSGFSELGLGHPGPIQYRLDLAAGELPRFADTMVAFSLSMSAFFMRSSVAGINVTPLTRVLVVMESVVGVSLIALFALALRRHFKR